MVIWPWGYRCLMCHRGSELTLIQLVVSSQPNPFQSSWIITPNNIMSNMDSIMIILWVSNNIVWLVVSTPLKNMRKSVGMIIPNIRKVIKFHGSKPPTSYVVIMNPSHHYGSQTIWMPVKSPLSEGTFTSIYHRLSPTVDHCLSQRNSCILVDI